MGLFDFGNINSLPGILGAILQLLAIAILIRALLSWVRPDPRNPIVQALDAITEPILQPLRQIIPRIGMIDITPMVAMVLLSFLGQLVANSGI